MNSITPCETLSLSTGLERVRRFSPQMNGYDQLPRGMVYAHTCFNKYCGTADHIVVVTQQENLLMGDINKNGLGSHHVCGHPRESKFGRCKLCNNARCRAYYNRKKAEAWNH